MIKRIRLAKARTGLAGQEFSRRWRDAIAAAAGAPPAAAPARLAVCVAATDIAAGQRYDGVALEWLQGPEHLARYEDWLAGAGGAAHRALLGEAADLAASPVVVAEEHVARGAQWLEQRWARGGARLKQLAIATRAPGLSLAQFLALWASRAGKIGATPIPAAYRGTAYLQNHPLVLPGRDWAYDAINEVYFDDDAALLARMDYFARELGGGGDDDLIGANWFLAVREEPVPLPTGRENK